MELEVGHAESIGTGGTMFIVGHTLASGGGLTTFPSSMAHRTMIFDNYRAAVEKCEIINQQVPHPVWEVYALMPITNNTKLGG